MNQPIMQINDEFEMLYDGECFRHKVIAVELGDRGGDEEYLYRVSVIGGGSSRRFWESEIAISKRLSVVSDAISKTITRLAALENLRERLQKSVGKI